jgi:hypothetical protein
LTLPFSVASVWVTPEAALVSTVGGLRNVLKVRSEPTLVPPALVAEMRKW